MSKTANSTSIMRSFTQKKIKTVFTMLLIFGLSTIGFCQRGGRERSYQIIGLPESEEVWPSFFYGLICSVLAFVIGKASIDKTGKMQNSNWIWVAYGFGIAAFFFFLPLLSWIEFAFVSVMSFVMFLAFIGFVGLIIYSFFKK